MELHVIITGRKDLADQLYRQLRDAIDSGRLVAGAQLPPSRLLAKQLGVSRKTVSDTYATLTYEGLLIGKTGRGTFVNTRAPHTERLQTATDLACAASLATWQALPSSMHHPTRDSDIVVTNGAQQALDLIARVVLEPGSIVAMEDPGYSPARQLFTAMGARVVAW